MDRLWGLTTHEPCTLESGVFAPGENVCPLLVEKCVRSGVSLSRVEIDGSNWLLQYPCVGVEHSCPRYVDWQSMVSSFSVDAHKFDACNFDAAVATGCGSGNNCVIAAALVFVTLHEQGSDGGGEAGVHDAWLIRWILHKGNGLMNGLVTVLVMHALPPDWYELLEHFGGNQFDTCCGVICLCVWGSRALGTNEREQPARSSKCPRHERAPLFAKHAFCVMILGADRQVLRTLFLWIAARAECASRPNGLAV